MTDLFINEMAIELSVIPSLREMINEDAITLESAYAINEMMDVIFIYHNGKFEISKED